MWQRRVPRHGGNGRHDRGVMLLIMLLRNIAALDRKPPLTLGLIGLMGSLHFQKMLSPTQFKRYSLCPNRVLTNGQVSRIVVSGFLHVDDVHLYHNMISFLWKGYHLEHRFGWLRFALAIVFLLLLCHGLVIALAFSLEHFVGMHGYLRQCSIGFSGVLFALKVLLNHGSPAFTNVYGLPVPTKYAAWLELVVIHMLVPGSSFIGHMCGILAGYIFVLTNSDTALIDPCARFLEKLGESRPLPQPRPRDFGSGTASHFRSQAPVHQQETDEEMTRRLQDEENRRATNGVRDRFEAYERSANTQPRAPPPVARELTQEELRRRRTLRFQNT